jgi:hypothetical protein
MPPDGEKMVFFFIKKLMMLAPSLHLTDTLPKALLPKIFSLDPVTSIPPWWFL